jgi:serine/threonine protein kinase
MGCCLELMSPVKPEDSDSTIISHGEIELNMDSARLYTNRKIINDALYGQILSATSKSSGERVVLKQLLRECVERKLIVSDLEPGSRKRKCVEDARLEISVLRRLNKNGGHPNVVRLHDDFETRKHLVMVMDYLTGGDLFDRVMNNGKLAEDKAQKYFSDAVGGLSFVHSHDVAHRDLSLENLLLNSQDRIVLTDFGLCCECADNQKQTQRVGKGFYIAPEIFNREGPYDPKKADVWSLGIVLFIIMTGKPPMERPSKQDKRFVLFQEGKMADILSDWGLLHTFSSECLELLSQMLRVDPAQRIGLDQVLAHAWVQSAPPLSPPRAPRPSSLELSLHSPVGVDDLCAQTDPLFSRGEEPHSPLSDGKNAKLNSYLNSFTVSGSGGSHLAKELQRLRHRECAV